MLEIGRALIHLGAAALRGRSSDFSDDGEKKTSDKVANSSPKVLSERGPSFRAKLERLRCGPPKLEGLPEGKYLIQKGRLLERRQRTLTAFSSYLGGSGQDGAAVS